MIHAYYTYASIVTPGHTDIETITEWLCTVITDTTRIRVHAQTVNVQDMTYPEVARLSMNEPDTEGNILRVVIEEANAPAELKRQFL